MPSIPELSRIGKVSLRRISARKRVMYPWLPAILDEDSLGAIATLEADELTFIRLQGKAQQQYLSALYLKAVAALGHAHFQPKETGRQKHPGHGQQKPRSGRRQASQGPIRRPHPLRGSESAHAPGDDQQSG